MDVVIYHNPACGTSRNVLVILQAAGYEPVIIDYLKTGWTRPQLLGLFASAGLKPREALRMNAAPVKELGLDDPAISDDQILEAMLIHHYGKRCGYSF